MAARVANAPRTPLARIVKNSVACLDALRGEELLTWDEIADLFASYGLDVSAKRWRAMYSRIQSKRRISLDRTAGAGRGAPPPSQTLPLGGRPEKIDDDIAPAFRRSADRSVIEASPDQDPVVAALRKASMARKESDR